MGATEAMKKLQVYASDAKVEADEKAAVANAKKLGKESTEEVKKTEIETEVKATAKKLKAAADKPTPEALQAPGGSEAENWTANMPAHHLEGYAQKARKDVSEQQLAENKDKEEDKEEDKEDDKEEEESDDEESDDEDEKEE